MTDYNNSPMKTPMPSQAPEERKHNFKEVALGYTEDMALLEARRCLQCRKPLCMEGCPVNVRIPDFIKRIAEGDYLGAYDVISETSSLPAICGRVCPQESQCEGRCARGIKTQPVGIGRLERFAADYAMSCREKKEVEETSRDRIKVAVIGSGPGGLAAAGDLQKAGYDVTVFEALHVPGGVLSYGIPEFRLPKELVKREINTLREKGVRIECNTVIGKTITMEELFSDMGYKAAYIGTGAGLPRFMGIEGENLCGVYSANEFLTRVNLMKAYDFPHNDTPVKIGKSAVIVGGGNVAMDAARCAVRLGAEDCHIVYRRSEEEMPARREEMEHAKEEGIIFDTLTSPVRIVGDESGWVTGVSCIKTELGEPDASGRRRPVNIEGSDFVIKADTVIMAIGNSPNPLVLSTTEGLSGDERGRIVTDEDGLTSIPGVYAGGDAVTGAATVILAMGAGKRAAAAMDRYLKEKYEKDSDN